MDMHDLAQLILNKLDKKLDHKLNSQLEHIMSAIVDALKTEVARAVLKIEASVAVHDSVRKQLADTQAQLATALANVQDPLDAQAIQDAIDSLTIAVATLA